MSPVTNLKRSYKQMLYMHVNMENQEKQAPQFQCGSIISVIKCDICLQPNILSNNII